MYCFSGFLEQNRPPCSRKREIDGGFGILDEKSDQSMFSIPQLLSSCKVRQTRRIPSSWPPGSDLGTSRISSPAPKQVNGWNRCWNLIASQKTDFGGAQFKGGKHGKQTGQTARAVYALDHRGKFQFCKESEEACSWVNASSTREIDCRICIQEALDKRDDLDKEQKSQILKHSEKDMFWEPDWMHRKH